MPLPARERDCTQCPRRASLAGPGGSGGHWLREGRRPSIARPQLPGRRSQRAPAAGRPPRSHPRRLRQPPGGTACELAKRQEDAASQEGPWGADWGGGCQGPLRREGVRSTRLHPPSWAAARASESGAGPAPMGPPSCPPASAPPSSTRLLCAPLCPFKTTFEPLPLEPREPGGSCLRPGPGRCACRSLCSDKGQTPAANL